MNDLEKRIKALELLRKDAIYNNMFELVIIYGWEIIKLKCEKLEIKTPSQLDLTKIIDFEIKFIVINENKGNK